MKYGPCRPLEEIPCACGHPHHVIEGAMVDASVYYTGDPFPMLGGCTVCGCQTFEMVPR